MIRSSAPKPGGTRARFRRCARGVRRIDADVPDERQDYGEDRYRKAGLLGGRLVMVVWTRHRTTGSPRYLDEKMQ